VVTTCPVCDRRWTGLSECHCTACHAHFSSDKTFDRHLAAPQSRDVCYDPGTLRDRHGRRVFKSVGKASGLVWMFKSDRPHFFAGKGAPAFSGLDGADFSGISTPESSEKAGGRQT
jgi:hypothetical protein